MSEDIRAALEKLEDILNLRVAHDALRGALDAAMPLLILARYEAHKHGDAEYELRLTKTIDLGIAALTS